MKNDARRAVLPDQHLTWWPMQRQLPLKYRAHPLKNNRDGHRDCHLRSDMVLLYRRSSTVLRLVRIGTHPIHLADARSWILSSGRYRVKNTAACLTPGKHPGNPPLRGWPRLSSLGGLF
jgi:hypothetical protein